METLVIIGCALTMLWVTGVLDVKWKRSPRGGGSLLFSFDLRRSRGKEDDRR